MQNIRAAIRRKLSLHDKNPNLDEAQDENDFDDETRGHLEKEAEKAENDTYHQGKPGSFLNKLIMHGNKKTEEQLARESAAANSNAAVVGKENARPA